MTHAFYMHYNHSTNLQIVQRPYHRLISSQINQIFLTKQQTIFGQLCAFLLILILNKSYHQTYTADYLTYIIAKAQLKSYQFSLPIIFISFKLLYFLCSMINILRQMKRVLIELMTKLLHFITQSIYWYYGLLMNQFYFFSLFSRENWYLISLLFVHYSVIKLRYFW